MADKKPAPSAACTEEEADQACKAIHSAKSTAELAEVLEEQSRDLLRCERATFFRLEKQDPVANLVGLRDEGRTRICFPVGEGIAGNVARDNGYYLCNEPEEDDLYVPAIDGIEGLTVRNIVSAAMSASEEIVGVLQTLNGPARGFGESHAYWLQRLAEHGALAYARLKRSEDGWALARNLAEAVATAVDDKHVSTVGHTDRTRQIALAIGRDMNLEGDDLLELEFAALLHDIGRLALSPEAFEWAAGPGGAAKGYAAPTERLHVVLTEAILRGIRPPASLARLAEIALAHHEKADGSGFPRGKKSTELPLSARILAVANAFDLLASGRASESLGKRLDDEEAVKVLKQRSGRDYDAAVVDRLARGKLYQIEKRRFPRYEYETPLEVTVLAGAGEAGKSETFETQALNLSEGGILFRASKKLPDNVLLKLKIQLPTETLDALARLARHIPEKDGKGFQAGAYFLWYGSHK